jgi:hypothetical protein
VVFLVCVVCWVGFVFALAYEVEVPVAAVGGACVACFLDGGGAHGVVVAELVVVEGHDGFDVFVPWE